MLTVQLMNTPYNTLPTLRTSFVQVGKQSMKQVSRNKQLLLNGGNIKWVEDKGVSK